MSDAKENYIMSDKLIMQGEKQDVPPGLVFNATLKRQHELLKQQEESNAKIVKEYRDQDQELRGRRLKTLIPKDSAAFQRLLQKMGFISEEDLENSVPGINDESSSSGVDHEHVRKVFKKKHEINRRIFKRAVRRFTSFNVEKRIFVALHKDYFKAQRICEELDFRMDVMEPALPFFWTKLTRSQLKINRSEYPESSDEEYDDDIDDVTEYNLKQMVIYLRTRYYYCIYCGDYIENNEDYCPGYYRVHHDD